MRRLTVFAPGLFGPDIPVQPEDLPNLPALNWLLARGKRTSINSFSPSYTLCQLCGLTSEAGQDLPIAALSRLSDDNQKPAGRWLRADPVHVTADRNELILFDQNRFKLSQHDALALAADISRLLMPYAMSLEVPMPYRWYLKVENELVFKTTPLDAVVGQDILPHMPSGDDRINLIQLMNEIQMTLHDSDVNKQREQNKMPPVNSLWFWGYGELPRLIKRQWSFIMSNDMLARGIAMVAATPYRELPESFAKISQLNTEFNGLIMINDFQKYSYYNDVEGWLEALIKYERDWALPLLNALKKNQITALELIADNHSIQLESKDKFKIWKKSTTLDKFK